jgi:hypothetical protein
MFNPNCALFALQVEKSDGTWRTIAQSVLTLDQDIGVNPSSIVSGGTIPESAGGGEASFIACDNIEVTPNSKNADSQRIIGEIYQAFFQNYARVFNQSNLTGRTVSTSKIVVGQGYSDFRFGRSESNTYLPRAPVSYSDKLGANVDVIDLINPERPLHSVAPIAERITQVEQTSPESLPSGIAPLTYQDTIDVARLQGLAYPAAFSELETLAELENYLIGKDINNLVKGRANMSLKATDQTGRLVGYLIAYEGQLNNGTEVLYIEDIAADPNSTRIGGRMINAFIEQYRRNYLEQGNLIPIYTEARGSTSYQILVKHLDRIGSDLGVSFEMRELGQRNIGNGEVMHDIVIVPSRRGESSL